MKSKLKLKIILPAAIILAIAGGIITYFSMFKNKSVISIISEKESAEETIEERNSPYDIAFGVWGDTQSSTEDFRNAINDIKDTEIPLDALVFNGDIVDQGIDSQYEAMKTVMEEEKDKIPKSILMSIGNHEFFDYEHANENADDVNAKIQKFLNFADRDKVYYDEYILGYHFIVLGSEDGNSPTANQMMAQISDTQYNWFVEKLNESKNNGKPVFVFLHQPLFAWNRAETNRSKQLRDLLLQHPEVYLFTSHDHVQLNNECISLDGVKTIKTGSVDYTLFNNQGVETRDRDLSYGIFVTVKGNKVTIKGRDFVTKEWIFEKTSES